MPVPTDQLSEEIKELGLRLTARMDGLEAGLRGLREEFVIFRERVDTHLAYIKWTGVFFSGILVALFLGALSVAYQAGGVSSDVKQQGKLLEQHGEQLKVQGEQLKLQGEQLKVQGEQLKLQSNRLDKVEKRLDGVEKRLDGVEKRLDGMTKQLDILIRRTEPKAKE
jgi:hypothetical protein